MAAPGACPLEDCGLKTDHLLPSSTQVVLISLSLVLPCPVHKFVHLNSMLMTQKAENLTIYKVSLGKCTSSALVQ